MQEIFEFYPTEFYPLVIQLTTQVLECLFSYVWDLEGTQMNAYISKEKGRDFFELEFGKRRLLFTNVSKYIYKG